MLLVAAFNPIASMSGSFVAQTLQVGSKIIIINKSYVDILFTFANGNTILVIANDRRGFTLNDVLAVGNPMINWQQQNIDYPQTVKQLENICYVEVYQPTEVVTETYPNTIVRETLPSLVPYNVGHTTTSIFDNTVGTAGKFLALFPSSYTGLAVAPTGIGGLGYDHFYLYQTVTLGVMPDIPAQYTGTGKVANDATPNNVNLMSYVPGPFSLAGLVPIDTGTFLNGTFWTLASIIPWASSTNGFLVEAWINIPAFPTTNMRIMGDEITSVSDAGIDLYIDMLGRVQVWVDRKSVV